MPVHMPLSGEGRSRGLAEEKLLRKTLENVDQPINNLALPRLLGASGECPIRVLQRLEDGKGHQPGCR